MNFLRLGCAAVGVAVVGDCIGVEGGIGVEDGIGIEGGIGVDCGCCNG